MKRMIFQSSFSQQFLLGNIKSTPLENEKEGELLMPQIKNHLLPDADQTFLIAIRDCDYVCER